MVGCAIARDGKIVGEGFHPKAGEPHAEVFALRQAGEKARGATLYVSLEPCNHYGRTPPCTEAIVAAGVGRVVAGTLDPDPRVSGGGMARLREAGIEAIAGVEEAACRRLNEAFAFGVRHQRPFGILKYAATLDGKIATDAGHSAWVSGPESRALVHLWRSRCDAVVVGGNTVRRDNPRLTSHHRDRRNPLRVVMTRSLDLPEEANLWDTAIAPTLVLTETGARPDFQQRLRDRGVEVVARSPLTPATATAYFYERGLRCIFWECGGTLAARAIADGAIQKVMAFLAPKIVGGSQTPVASLGLARMDAALPLYDVSARRVGEDWAIEGYLQKLEWF